MCGIFGVVSGNPNARTDIAKIDPKIRHRGPDAFGSLAWTAQGGATFHPQPTEIAGSVVLAHWRLSIFDLTDAGRQPVQSKSGRYWLTYNGEIYNFLELRDELVAKGVRFETATDTEVLLAAWEEYGPECLNKFVGMFAFLLLDQREQKLFAVRDFFGIKPLFVAEQRNKVVFSSELSSLVSQMPGDVAANDRELAFYLRFGVVERTEKTLLAGVERVPPGQYWVVDCGTGKVERKVTYYALPEETLDISFEEATRRVRDALLRSVELHMRADVPYSVTLSGGIDSSAIVCCMREVSSEPINTFTYVADASAISEERWADMVNQRVGAIAHKIRLDWKDLEADLDTLVRMQGEPFIGLSIYAEYKVYQAIHAAGIRVNLDGQGGDEAFAGYIHYLGDRMADHLRSFNVGETMRWSRAVRRNVSGVSGPMLVGLGMERVIGGNPIGAGLVTRGRAAMGRSFDLPWFQKSFFEGFGQEFAAMKTRKPRGSYLKAGMHYQIFHGALQEQLRYDDKDAMASSVENRVPFVTPEIIGLGYALPDRYLVSDQGVTKHVLREAMRGIVPDEILDRKDKIGFAPDTNRLFDRGLFGRGANQDVKGLADRAIDWSAYAESLNSVSPNDSSKVDALWRALNVERLTQHLKGGAVA